MVNKLAVRRAARAAAAVSKAAAVRRAAVAASKVAAAAAAVADNHNQCTDEGESLIRLTFFFCSVSRAQIT